MIDCNVPIMTILWSGTGIVIVLPSSARFCIIMWLPFCRTGWEPCRSMMLTISAREKEPSLGASNLYMCEQRWLLQTSFDFFRTGNLKEAFDGFFEISDCFLD